MRNNKTLIEPLQIRRIKTYTVRHGRQVRVSEETYEKIKDIANEVNRNIGEVSEMIMDWAIENVEIVG